MTDQPPPNPEALRAAVMDTEALRARWEALGPNVALPVPAKHIAAILAALAFLAENAKLREADERAAFLAGFVCAEGKPITEGHAYADSFMACLANHRSAPSAPVDEAAGVGLRPAVESEADQARRWTGHFNQSSTVLERRLASLTRAEITVLRRYFDTLATLQANVPTGDPTGEAARLLGDWRRRLCAFLGVVPGFMPLPAPAEGAQGKTP